MVQQDGAEPQEVLEEEVDPTYEPTEQEVQDYASWLGMDLEEEKELMWIAREGLKAPLPEGWKPCKTPKGDVYYFNFASGASIWDHPCDEHFRNLYQNEKEKLQKRKKAEGGKKAGLDTGRLPSPNPTSKSATGRLSGELGVDRQASGKPPLAAASATSLANVVDPRERRKLNRHSKSGLSSLASSLHSSFDVEDNLAPGGGGGGGNGGGASAGVGTGNGGGNSGGGSGSLSNSREPLAPLRGVYGGGTSPGSQSGGALTKGSPLGVPLGVKVPPLGSVPASPSASGSDWPAWNAPPQHLGTLKVPSRELRSTSAEREQRRGSMQGEFEAERAEIERRHAEQVNKLKEDASAEEASVKEELEESSRLVILDFKQRLQVQEERERQELSVRQQQQLSLLDTQHQQRMSDLQRQQEQLEAEMQGKVSASQEQVKAGSTAFEEELGARRDSARTDALKKVEAEVAAWAEGQKVMVRQQALEAVSKQVEDEIRPFKEERMAEALGRAAKQAAEEAEQLQAKVSEARKQLSDLETQLSSKSAAAKAAAADLEACKEQLPELEASMRVKLNEKSRLEEELTAQRPVLKQIMEDLRAKQREAAEAEAKLEAYNHQLKPASIELERIETALYATRKSLATEEVELQKAKAQRSVEEQQLAAIKSAVQEKQATLESMEVSLTSQQQELAKVTADLGKARSDMMTQDVTLAGELRERAGAELHGLEEELSRCKAELQALTTQLTSRKSEHELLGNVSTELQDKQQRCNAVRIQLSTCQADLAALESDVAAKRSQLDTVASLLTSKRKELSAEEQRKAIHDEEKLLLEMQRQQMERGVEEKVQTERAQLLASKLDAMHAEVKGQVDKAEAGARSQVDQAEAGARSRVEKAEAEAKRVEKGEAEANSQAEKEGQKSEPAAAATAASKRPQLETNLPGNALDLSSSVLVDSPVLPEDRKEAPPGTAAGTGRWWNRPAPMDRDKGEPTRTSLNQDASWAMPSAKAYAPSTANGALPHSHPPTHYPKHFLPTQQQQQHTYQQQPAGVLPKALAFIKQQKHFLRERSAMIQNAVAEWRVAMAAADHEPDPVLWHQQASLLRGVKATLEEQAHRVNADTMQLTEIKSQVRALEAQQGVVRGGRRQGGGSNRRGHAAWQTESGEDTDLQAFSSSSRGTGGTAPAVRTKSAPPLEHTSLRASIEKIGMALEDAVAAAVAQGIAAASRGANHSHTNAVASYPNGRRPSRPRSASAGPRRLPLNTSSLRTSTPPLPTGLHAPYPSLSSASFGGGVSADRGGQGLLGMLHDATHRTSVGGGCTPVVGGVKDSSLLSAPFGAAGLYGSGCLPPSNAAPTSAAHPLPLRQSAAVDGLYGNGFLPPPNAAATEAAHPLPLRQSATADGLYGSGYLPLSNAAATAAAHPSPLRQSTAVDAAWVGEMLGHGGHMWEGAAHPPGWMGHLGPKQLASTPPSQLAFLSQWQDKSDMSEALLHQHASWLRGFREQVERGAASMAVRGKAAALNNELSAF